MIVKFLFTVLLTMSAGSTLEISGDLVQAGQIYQEENDLLGQIRVLGRFLEEALYAGRTQHAMELLMVMELYPIEKSYYDFWYARLSWSCGLSEFACNSLDSISGDPWLSARSRGLAAQFRGDAATAADYFRQSWLCATSTREKFYSALDLCFSLVQTGDLMEAQTISTYLSEHFPGEGLPRIAFALSLHSQNRFGEAMTVLQSVSDGDYTGSARHLASSLLEDME